VTVILLTCAYNNQARRAQRVPTKALFCGSAPLRSLTLRSPRATSQEFIRVGYYVNNEYADEALREAPPASVAIERVTRNILAEKPRVTRFPIAFDAAAIPSGAALEQQGGFGAEPQFGGGGGSSVGFGAAAAFGGGTGSMGLGGVEGGQEGGEAMMMMS
jgi:hypothetical protein